jgi:hypothetical protein
VFFAFAAATFEFSLAFLVSLTYLPLPLVYGTFFSFGFLLTTAACFFLLFWVTRLVLLGFLDGTFFLEAAPPLDLEAP